MAGDVLRALWSEPRPPHPPARVWRDWVLVAALLAWAVLETLLLGEGLAWRPVALGASTVVALSLLWRRTHPLAAVVVAFGVLTVIDLARIPAAADARLLMSVSGALVLPYALFRWGSGREAVTGLGVVLAWLGVTHVADPTGVTEGAAGVAFFLFSAALGASLRFQASARLRDIEQAKLRQRAELARELHDSIGHHVSAIAIQAQAGRVLSASDPDRAAAVLRTIEETASRALAEMRVLIGVLRGGAGPDLAPQPGLADIERLARDLDGGPRVEVRLSGDLDDLSPSVAVALYRIAQESVTNALRHAPGASRIDVRVAETGDQVGLTVSDDGDAGATPYSSRGYGLVGMTERTVLLGGTLRAGPGADRGWTVHAVLPKHGAT